MDQLFLAVNQWMTQAGPLAALGCFVWGLISVLFSPCHLASIPLIVGYVAGQGRIVEGREAAGYAGLFTLGLFLSIAAVGAVCAFLGRMLGDIGPYWTIPVGLVLVWVSLDMLGVAKCSLPGGALSRLKLKGGIGAFVLGLSYGLLSGACTFGFIAPILAIVTVQKQVAAGLGLILLFAVGHSLPILAAGCSAALARRLLETRLVASGGVWFRKAAGALVALLGLYFIGQPFFGA
jgi:cytochrome c-type biogenesis protein